MPEEALAALFVDLQQRGWRSAGRRDTKQIEPGEHDRVIGSPGRACDAAHRVADLDRCAAA